MIYLKEEDYLSSQTGFEKDHFKGGEKQSKKITDCRILLRYKRRKSANKSSLHGNKPKAITQGNHVCKQQGLGSIVQLIKKDPVPP